MWWQCQELWPPRIPLAYPSVAVPQGTSLPASSLWQLHSMARQKQGHLQNRRFCQSCSTLGQAKKSTGHELRQTQQINPAILQKGNYEEDRKITKAGLSVLSPIWAVEQLWTLKNISAAAGLWHKIFSCILYHKHLLTVHFHYFFYKYIYYDFDFAKNRRLVLQFLAQISS